VAGLVLLAASRASPIEQRATSEFGGPSVVRSPWRIEHLITFQVAGIDSGGDHTAVDVDCLPRNPFRFVGGEIHDERADVLGGAHPSDRDLLCQ